MLSAPSLLRAAVLGIASAIAAAYACTPLGYLALTGSANEFWLQANALVDRPISGLATPYHLWWWCLLCGAALGVLVFTLARNHKPLFTVLSGALLGAIAAFVGGMLLARWYMTHGYNFVLYGATPQNYGRFMWRQGTFFGALGLVWGGVNSLLVALHQRTPKNRTERATA